MTDSMTIAGADDAKAPPIEILKIFGKLGLTSFGGPVAHIGYFRQAFVVERKWLDEPAYADIVALAQFLPGPASSQVVFTLGLLRGGWRGGLAASAGFTLPSAIAMVLFAYLADSLGGTLGGIIHGLKLVAVAIVAQAVWGMANSLCPDRTRAGIALAAMALVTAAGGSAAQIVAIVLGGCAGAVSCDVSPSAAPGSLPPIPVSRGIGALFLALFGILLALPSLVSQALASQTLASQTLASQTLALFDAFYRSGALVFGGGHVVLPLLRAAVVEPGWVTPDAFLAGYGAAQAVPGPLFTFAAYLGAVVGPPPHGVTGAVIALIAIFLPGLLLMAGALPFWDAFRRRQSARAAMMGTNAAVVGVLAAALYDPVWTSAIHDQGDFAIAAIGFALLTIWRLPALWVVFAITCVAAARV